MKHVHRVALVAQEVIDLGEHEPRHVSSACLIYRLAEAAVVRRALDKVVDECTGIADECSRLISRPLGAPLGK